jgi:hypothetical protein
MKKILGVFVAILLIVGCATTDSSQTASSSYAKTGFLKGYYDRLEPGPEDGAKLRWIKPDVDWGRYNYVMLDSVVFFFDDASEYKGIDPQELKELADNFNKQLVDTLKDTYPIKTEPALDVLRIRFAITNLKHSNPVISGITTVVPVGLGVSVIKKGATGSWSGSGATSVEMMALDAMTSDVLVVAKDEQSADFTDRFSEWGSAEEAFKFWAERVKNYLDKIQGK